MAWFWGSGSKKEEYSDEEYDSEELYTDEEYEDDDDDDDDEEGSFYDEEEEKEENSLEEEKDEHEATLAEEKSKPAATAAVTPPSEEDVSPPPTTNDPTTTATDDALNQTKTNNSSNIHNNSESSSSSSDDGEEVEAQVQEEVEKGVLPAQVSAEDLKEGGNRPRLDSGLTFGEDGPEDALSSSSSSSSSSSAASLDPNSKNTTEESNGKQEEKEEEEATSLQEKQSLLVLAAEHDRVDILQAILTVDESDTTVEEAPLLLQGGWSNSSSTAKNATTIPPLHIAVSYGSVHATNCLLRMGADPSIRPVVAVIREQQQESAVEIAHMARYNERSAWEIVFGSTTTTSNDTEAAPQSSWFGSSSKKDNEVFDIAPSKREGIRHAFTAEALRCIGSDEVERLEQLLNAGMPREIDIGGKNLYSWAVEMNSVQCQELLQPAADAAAGTAAKDSVSDPTNEEEQSPKAVTKQQTAVLDRAPQNGEEASLASLRNRLEELESLAKALSSCLDNLGEEVAVCSGLLLMGSGASALASHVKSLRLAKEQKEDKCLRLMEAAENSQDELAYWVRECGPEGEAIAAQQIMVAAKSSKPADPEPEDPEALQKQRRQLQAQIAASESKTRMLRVSIADLSEENTRNLAEVEKRGLTGGINLVRGLREEIRDIDFQLSELKTRDAECRTKISLVQSKLREIKASQPQEALASVKKAMPPADVEKETVASTNDLEAEEDPPCMVDEADYVHVGGRAAREGFDLTGSELAGRESQTTGLPSDEAATAVTAAATANQSAGGSSSEEDAKPKAADSSQIATGQSTAIAIRGTGRQGFFPISLWQILMRIIGIGDDPVLSPRRSAGNPATPAVII